MKRIAEIVQHPLSTGSTLTVAADVSMEKLNIEYALNGPVITQEIANRTEDIELLLVSVWARAKNAGFGNVHVVAESTGVYHALLLRIAHAKGMQASLVDPAAVKAMRKVIFGDAGKTDERDPSAIRELALRNHLLKRRILPEITQTARRYNVIYDIEERGIIRAKCLIHRCLKSLFPDLNFSQGYEYSNSGRAIMKAYGFNPHAIVRSGRKRVTKKLKGLVPRIRTTTIERLMKYAEDSVRSAPAGRVNSAHTLELQFAWEDLELHEKRRDDAREMLESLYDEACEIDPNLPKPAKGFASKANLARLFAEIGPMSDFQSWRQLMKFTGLNLCERKSGKFKGQTKISKTGRKLARKILQQMALPLVKRNALYGAYYHHKRYVEKAEGGKIMTNVARKLLKKIWGIYKSGGDFIAERVFLCESQCPLAA